MGVGGPSYGRLIALGLPATMPRLLSACEPFRKVMQGNLEQGLSAQRIHQDTVAEHGFISGYVSFSHIVFRILPHHLN